MIRLQTLAAVKDGILTDEQLEEAIQHYSMLEQNLKLHGDIFYLTWREVCFTLNKLEQFKELRETDRVLRNNSLGK